MKLKRKHRRIIAVLVTNIIMATSMLTTPARLFTNNQPRNTMTFKINGVELEVRLECGYQPIAINGPH